METRISDDKLSKMRPCVAGALINGSSDEDHFRKMRQAIIYELNRITIDRAEIKSVLMDWNQRNHKRFTEGDARRKLCDYVDWFFKHDCKMSCKALTEYCLFGGCGFQETSYQGEIELPFSLQDADSYLMTECMPHGYLMACLIKILYAIQKEKNARKIIFVGLRTLQSRVLEEFHHNLDLMSILRALNMLEEKELIRMTHGKRGTFTACANGYTFLPWVRPQRIITHMCNTSETHYCVTDETGKERAA